MTLEIPDWCIIGKIIEWNRPDLTGTEWVREEILSFGYNGFFHQGCSNPNYPIYYTEFSEYGKTVRECKEKRRKKYDQ